LEPVLMAHHGAAGALGDTVDDAAAPQGQGKDARVNPARPWRFPARAHIFGSCVPLRCALVIRSCALVIRIRPMGEGSERATVHVHVISLDIPFANHER
jgi:hypothetical protein